MRRAVLLFAAAGLAVVPAVLGLAGNTTFSQSVPAVVPAGASVLPEPGPTDPTDDRTSPTNDDRTSPTNDDRTSTSWSDRTSDDSGKRSDDNSGKRSDDNSGKRSDDDSGKGSGDG